MSTGKKDRSREQTWGEKELARYVGSDRDAKQKTPGAHGSPKSQPKDRSTKQRSGSQVSKPSSRSDGKDLASSSKDRVSDKHPSPATGRKQDTSAGDGKGLSDSSKRTAEKPHPGSQRADKDAGKSREGGQKSTRAGGRRQEAKTDGKSTSDSKSRDPRRAEVKEDGARRKEGEVGRGRGSREEATRSSGTGRQKDRDAKGGRDRERGRQEETRKPGSKTRGGAGREKGLSDRSSSRLRGSSSGSLPRPHGKEPEKRRREGEKRRERAENKQDGKTEEGVEQVGGASAMGRGLQPMVEVTEEVMEEYQYDMDEDFQDYEEDFDEELESSDSEEGKTTPTGSHTHTGRMDLVEIMEAIDAENRMVGMATQQTSTEDQQEGHPSPPPPSLSHPSPPAPPPAPGRALMDFSSAHKREVIERAARKAKTRGQELMGLIELDIVTYDLFDLPPLSEYEVYIKNFGSNDTRQVSVQTGDDNMEQETQTEEVGVVDKWVQWPPEDLRGYGGPSDGEDDWLKSEPLISGQSTLRLAAFIKRATQVCSVLLEENLSAVQAQSSAHSSQSPFHSTKSPLSFCSTCLRIQTLPPFLAGRHATHVQFSPSQDYLLLAAYSQSPAAVEATPLKNKGLLCIWNTREPSQPQSVLVCEATPTSCCFSPQKASLVFAGNDDGSLVLWDLREPPSMHQPPSDSQLSQLGTLTRVPTFCTAGIPHLEGHRAPVISITPISAEGGGGAKPGALTEHSEEDSVGLSFQLASLDRSGRLLLWVVVQLSRPEPHGSESDLGLVPGGRVKLVKSASVEVCREDPASRQPSVVASVQANCVQFHPLDSSHLYIGADTGKVHHLTRYGRRPIPRHYLSPQPEGACACDVTSLSFSPWQPEHFLAGCSDGSIRLYHTRRATPLVSWPHSTAGSGMRLVQWSEHRPGLFLAQDCHSTVYVWDLLKNDAEPVHKEQLRTNITYCRLSPLCDSTHKPHPCLLLALADGSLELHYLHNSLFSPSQSSDSFNTYLDSLE